MKTQTTILTVLGFILQPLVALHAGTTIDTVNRYAYGGNIGWVIAVDDDLPGWVAAINDRLTGFARPREFA